MEKQYPVQEILLSDIFLDRETQIRVSASEETVQRYFDVMIDENARDSFPPILLFRDHDGRLWLVDGHHRVMAAKRRKFATIKAIIISGTKSDAIWEAAKANGRNGLPLSRADIRRAVEMICAACPDRSNVLIAERLGCDEKTVRKYRPEKATSGNSTSDKSEVEYRIGKDGKNRPAKRRRKPEAVAQNPDTAPTSPPVAEESAQTENIPQTEERPTDANGCETVPDDRRRIEANVKETQIQATISQLRIQIDEWFEVAPEDMHDGFAERIRNEIRQLID